MHGASVWKSNKKNHFIFSYVGVPGLHSSRRYCQAGPPREEVQGGEAATIIIFSIQFNTPVA
jgi:hypothetical protein